MSSQERIRASEAGPGEGRPLREGLGNGIDALCEMLRASLRADVCVIALAEGSAAEPRLYPAGAVYMRLRSGAGGTSRLGARLLLRPADGPLLYNRPLARSQRTGNRYRGTSLGAGEAHQRLAALAELLKVGSLLTVPLGQDESYIGRVYVGSNQERYTSRDLQPLWHGAKHACMLIESVRLAERLAMEVASQERRRISRDLHDSAIQPYIGLKLGLEALRRRLAGTELATELDELVNIASDGIGELRHYVCSLKKAETHRRVASLLTAVRTQARKFAELYGIEAQVIAKVDIPVSAPLQNEIMHIIREGLSNIRRHTCAEHATINLREAQGRVVVELINDKARRGSKQRFFPRSIGERARELGGRVSVQHRNGNRTVVAVELPLHGAA